MKFRLQYFLHKVGFPLSTLQSRVSLFAATQDWAMCSAGHKGLNFKVQMGPNSWTQKFVNVLLKNAWPLYFISTPYKNWQRLNTWKLIIFIIQIYSNSFYSEFSCTKYLHYCIIALCLATGSMCSQLTSNRMNPLMYQTSPLIHLLMYIKSCYLDLLLGFFLEKYQIILSHLKLNYQYFYIYAFIFLHIHNTRIHFWARFYRWYTKQTIFMLCWILCLVAGAAPGEILKFWWWWSKKKVRNIDNIFNIGNSYMFWVDILFPIYFIIFIVYFILFLIHFIYF